MMDNIHKSWNKLFDQYDFDLDRLYNSRDTVYPSREQIFRVFEMDVSEIRVLLLGQDPYHNPGQANGLSFSVNDGIAIPPSLRNIYKELMSEFPERNYVYESGNLERWFKEEKIFLLNASLSVIKNDPSSHMHIWSDFTDDVIKYVAENNQKCVFVLLGNFAKSKAKFIQKKHNVITGVHPSPFSCNHGFFGSGIFKNIEQKLGREIDWMI